MHKAHEKHATNHLSTSYPSSSDGQLHDKPDEINLDDNMGDNAKKMSIGVTTKRILHIF
jgi:hypothetical protein